MFPERLSAAAIRKGLKTGVLGRRVLLLERTASTMDVARQEAERGAPEGLLVLAEEQTAGRGRFGRRWTSPPGVNLYISLLLRPSLAVLPGLGMAAGLAVARALRRTTPCSPLLKWPNDVLLNREKVAGLLIESQVEGERVRYAVLGVGINVNWDPTAEPEVAGLATSLSREVGRTISRLAVLRAFLEEMDALYTHLREGGSVWEEWRGLLVTLGQRVRVAWGEQVVEGVAVDVDRSGSLVLQRPDGSTVHVSAGDVTILKE